MRSLRQRVTVIVDVDVIGPVIVAVHLNVNGPVAVIDTVGDARTLAEC